MDRAYSLLEIKAIDEDKRIITGIATTPTVDRVGDIVEPKGVEFKLPLPLLWQHDADQPIGWVKSAKVTKAGIEIRAELAKVEERGPLRARLDDAWQSIKTGLVRGLSIGFKGTEISRMDDGGIRFIKWLWLELSAVTIPANADASIMTIRNLDALQRAATGRELKASKVAPGGSGGEKLVLNPKGNSKMKTVAEQIAALEAKRQAKAARMEAIAGKSADEGREMDEAEGEEFDELTSELEAIDVDLKRLNALERARKTAKAVDGKTAKAGTDSRVGIVTMRDNCEKGIGFARMAMCLAQAKGNRFEAMHLAKERYPSMDSLHNVLSKTVTPGGTTTGTTYAAPLVDYQNLTSDFIEYLNPMTIIGKFGTGGIPSLRRVPFNVKVPRAITQGGAAWVGEGKAKGVVAHGFDSVTLTWAKVASISVLSDELVRFSSPGAEALVRDMLAAAIAVQLDTTFIGTAAANAGSAGEPAGIRVSGTDTTASVGDTADDVREDVKTLLGYFSADNNLGGLVWIMPETLAISLMLMRNELGQDEFPGITAQGGVFMGYPVIVSNTAPSGVVTLVKPQDIFLADDGGVTIDVSREATVAMNTAPQGDISIDASPTFVAGLGGASEGTDLVSLWQQNAVGVRAERYITWAKRRAGAAAYLSSVTWGTPESP